MKNTKRIPLLVITLGMLLLVLLYNASFMFNADNQEATISPQLSPKPNVVNEPLQTKVVPPREKVIQEQMSASSVNEQKRKGRSTKDEMLNLKRPPQKFKHYYAGANKFPSLNTTVFSEIEEYYGLPSGLLYFQMMKESGGLCPMTANRSGAIGCFQFNEGTAMDFSLIQNGEDFRGHLFASADAAARYLKWLNILMFGEKADSSDWEQLRYALAAFNAGHGNVRVRGGLKMPSFSETLNYVHEIESLTAGRSVTILQGDTLSTISARVGIPVPIILTANPNVWGDRSLFAGASIALPDPETGFSEFLVTRGITLRFIQKGTGVPLSLLKSTNNLVDDDTLYVGDVLKIPTGYMQRQPATKLSMQY